MHLNRMYLKRSILAVLLSVPILAVSAETEWKAGISSVKITPDTPVLLSGYASRTKPFERVEHDLYAKALALEDREGNRAVLITTDLLGLSKQIVEPIWAELEQKTGLDRRQFLFSASHTHAGPMLRRSDESVSGLADKDGENVVAYTRQLQKQLAALAVEALDQLEPARLSWGGGIAHFTMNRREFTDRGVILGVNPKGPVDRSVPVLRVDSADGTLRGLVFGYACHNTTLTGNNYDVCGDYAGFAQLHVQQQFPGVQAMFIAGCGGDSNPHPRGTMELAREHGTVLGQEVCRVAGAEMKTVRGPIRCQLELVELPLQSLSAADLATMASTGASWQRDGVKKLLQKIGEGESPKTSYATPVALWQFGDDLTLVGLPGEVVVDYVSLIENAIGPLRLWVAAYCNDVFGYLPSARVLEEGGYECRGLYTDIGWFAPNAQDVMSAKVRDLARKAGRPMKRASD